MNDLIKFINSQESITIATKNNDEIWTATAYYAADKNCNMYFISQKGSKHSQMIMENPNISFTISWFKPKDHSNRKGVQGLGTCQIVKNPVEIATGLKLMYKSFSDLRDILTPKWIKTNIRGSKLWVIKPSYIKYWDDELYSDDKTKEFNF